MPSRNRDKEKHLKMTPGDCAAYKKGGGNKYESLRNRGRQGSWRTWKEQYHKEEMCNTFQRGRCGKVSKAGID